ncbi:MAG: tyrosine-type recombinase/integrase [Jatrophihabitantaceae bacterium]
MRCVSNQVLMHLVLHQRVRREFVLVFAGVRGGGALRGPIFRHAAFDRAAEAIGLPGLHPHELRHTAASLAIAAGADIKVVQKMLGHKSATMTLDQRLMETFHLVARRRMVGLGMTQLDTQRDGLAFQRNPA